LNEQKARKADAAEANSRPASGEVYRLNVY